MRDYITRFVLIFVVFVLAMMGLTGCQQRKQFRIGVSQCSQDDWREKMNEEIEREAMFIENADIEIRSADDSNEKQIADIRYFADNNFDIIIAAPNEAEAITPIIDEVYKKGIPVIIFDRDINSDSYTAHITTDNHGIGVSAAGYALSMLKSAGLEPTAIEINGLRGSSPAIERKKGFDEVFTANGGRILGSADGNWNQPDAERVADSLLTLFPNVNLIYAHNDRMAIGASNVAKRKGLNNIKVIGIDAAPEIGIKAVADSVIDATFLYPTEGQRIIQTAMKILRGEPYSKEIRLPNSSAVDLTNADILLIQNESIRNETEKMKAMKTQVDAYWSAHSAQTSLFYAVIVILALAFITLFLVLRAFWQRKRHQQELMEQNHLLEQQSEQQKELNRQLQEATRSKLAFYTNVSHDLRTPLTLISEPIRQIAGADNLTPRQQTLAKIADKNVKILQRLINQILDFRKYENNKLSLNLSEMDFRQAADDWIEAFKEVARKRDIKLLCDSPDADTPIILALDAEKMERIFFNLLSNSFKYTPDNGTIHITYSLDGDTFQLQIADSGKGISKENLANIFDRFFRVDEVKPNGSGIGLALVKAFVELHGGTINAESKLGVGTRFTVRIPVRHVAETAVKTAPLITESDVIVELGAESTEAAQASASLSAANEADGAPATELPSLLIIDDNPDIRSLINQLLGDEYEIHQAENGREGLAKAARLVPDIIICDIMMPVMDGLECCRRIKAEISTSHIPVLMLTACSMDEQRIEGYESGADGYISKPFNGELLRSRCRNLLANRKRILNLWQAAQNSPAAQGSTAAGIAHSSAREASAALNSNSEAKGQPSSAIQAMPAPTIGNVDLDNEFYARFLKIFMSEISNPDISIEQIASRMGLGHSQFYRKIKALTNYTPVELMRQLRLKQGRHLLTTTSKSISEIAYEVGFSSPAYFTKCYRIAFGETPSDLRDNLGQ